MNVVDTEYPEDYDPVKDLNALGLAKLEHRVQITGELFKISISFQTEQKYIYEAIKIY